MSYLHCPTCRCAYNVAIQPLCPRCGVSPGAPDDVAEAILAALEQLAKAMTRATPDEMARVHARLEQRAQPALAEPAAAAAAAELALVADARPLPRPSLTRRLRSWTKQQIARPVQRARELLRAA